jgi:hypothetical protein
LQKVYHIFPEEIKHLQALYLAGYYSKGIGYGKGAHDEDIYVDFF